MKLNTIHHEDCQETMNKLDEKSIDCVLTSPPYNTSRNGSSLVNPCENIRYDFFDDNKSDNEYIDWTISLFNGFDRVLKHDGVILYNLSYSSELTHLMWLVLADIIRKTNFTIADSIVWKKKNASPNSSSKNKLTRICEFVFVFCRKNEISTFETNKKIKSKRPSGQPMYENIYNLIEAKNNDNVTDIHKATFSTELVRKLILIYINKKSIIYDPFMGTGTTAIASIIEGHDYIGSEISKNYIKYSEKRISTYQNQLRIF